MTTPPGVIDVSDRPVRRPSHRGRYGTNWQPGLDRQNPPSNYGTHPGDVSVTMTVECPLLDYGPSGVAGLVDELVYAVAAQALSNVQYNLDRSIQHPTPYYETQIRMDRVGTDMVVHDRGIVYGPWLEGVDSRNTRSRFKGYRSFRRATEGVARQAEPIAIRVVADYVREVWT
jgi:hypothetical protein